MANYHSDPVLNNCMFIDNYAVSDGGGMLNYDSATSLVRCVFYRNSAGYGGGVYNHESSPMLEGCLINENYAAYAGGGMASYVLSSPTIDHTILCGNTVGKSSDPADAPQAYEDDGSTLIEVGDSCLVAICESDDQGDIICADPCIGDLNGDGTVNSADLGLVLSSWGSCGDDCPADINGDGMVDGVDLSYILGYWASCITE
jgi:hypothetical protein